MSTTSITSNSTSKKRNSNKTEQQQNTQKTQQADQSKQAVQANANSGSTTATATADNTAFSAEAKDRDQPSSSVDAISRGLMAESTPEASATADKAEPASKPASQLGDQLGTGIMKKGMNSDSVGALQTALNDRLGIKLDTDGDFGPKTVDAVKKFQRSQGLKADGIVGKDTREALLAGSAPAAKPEAKPEAKAEEPAAQPEAKAARPGDEAGTADQPKDGEAPKEGEQAQEGEQPKPRTSAEYGALKETLGDKTLEPGSKNRDAVSALQTELNSKLGLDLDVDGKFGKATGDAIRKFQEENGLEVDGKLNDKTREALLGPKPPATREELQDREAERQQKATESAPDMIFGDRISADERAKVAEIAKELNTQPDELMAVFGVETGGSFDPAQRAHGNPNGAIGLIQFTQTAVDAMNERREAAGEDPISKKQLGEMDFNEQLDHVRDYLRDTLAERGVEGPVGREELYTAVFAPSAINRSDNAKIYSRGSDAYRANRSLDTDRNGHITREEIVSRVNEWYDQGIAARDSGNGEQQA